MAKDNKKDTKKRAAPPPRSKKQRGSIIDYFKGVRLEMKKVVWPTKKELGSYTSIVLITCAAFALVFWGIDSGFLWLLKALLGITL